MNEVVSDENSCAAKHCIHWYVPKDGKCGLHAKYVQSYLTARHNETAITWKDTVDSEAPITNFEALIRVVLLPLAVRNILSCAWTTLLRN